MKVLKKIAVVVVIACVCMTLGGIRVAEAATCPPHGAKKEVGSLLYYETTSHSDIYLSIEYYIDEETDELIRSETYRLVECYSTTNYSEVAEVCTSCGAVTGRWKEKIQYLHTNPSCVNHRKNPIRTIY